MLHSLQDRDESPESRGVFSLQSFPGSCEREVIAWERRSCQFDCGNFARRQFVNVSEHEILVRVRKVYAIHFCLLRVYVIRKGRLPAASFKPQPDEADASKKLSERLSAEPRSEERRVG